MGRSRIDIPKDVLHRLYRTEGWSPIRIAALYKCDPVTVRTRIREYRIPKKTKSQAQMRYAKYDFDGTATERAYLLGFRYGDLHVYSSSRTRETIVVRSHTTHNVQLRLFERLLGPYGHITTSSNGRSTQQTCYLNRSFAFLLGKYRVRERRWILDHPERIWAFAAGYIDAEGTFGLNQGRGRFKIDAYDRAILRDLHAFFVSNGINCLLRKIARKGENDYGWTWKQDVWRLSINEAASLESLLTKCSLFMQHEKRVADANIVLKNIKTRREHGTIR